MGFNIVRLTPRRSLIPTTSYRGCPLDRGGGISCCPHFLLIILLDPPTPRVIIRHLSLRLVNPHSFLEPRMSDDGDGSGWKGLLIFILIFGLGNVILYLTTGFLIIPIK